MNRGGLLFLRDLARPGDKLPQDDSLIGRGAHQEAPPGRRRKGDRGAELGVVSNLRAPRRVRPAPVEDVLPVAVGLSIEQRRAEQDPALAVEDVAGLPAGLLADALARLERAEEGVLDEGGIVAGERVPLRRADLREVLYDFDSHTRDPRGEL